MGKVSEDQKFIGLRPAFPTGARLGDRESIEGGLTKLEYFTALAMAAHIKAAHSSPEAMKTYQQAKHRFNDLSIETTIAKLAKASAETTLRELEK